MRLTVTRTLMPGPSRVPKLLLVALYVIALISILLMIAVFIQPADAATIAIVHLDPANMVVVVR